MDLSEVKNRSNESAMLQKVSEALFFPEDGDTDNAVRNRYLRRDLNIQEDIIGFSEDENIDPLVLCSHIHRSIRDAEEGRLSFRNTSQEDFYYFYAQAMNAFGTGAQGELSVCCNAADYYLEIAEEIALQEESELIGYSSLKRSSLIKWLRGHLGTLGNIAHEHFWNHY